MSARTVQLIASQKASKRTGTKSGFLALLDGYIFNNFNSANTVSYGWRHYWKCKNCSARLITSEEDVVVSVDPHACEKSMKEVSFC
jgi:hypothetical protein